MRIRKVGLAFAVSMCAFASAMAAAEPAPQLAVKSGDKIAFPGDSITANGARPNGYVTMVMDA